MRFYLGYRIIRWLFLEVKPSVSALIFGAWGVLLSVLALLGVPGLGDYEVSWIGLAGAVVLWYVSVKLVQYGYHKWR